MPKSLEEKTFDNMRDMFLGVQQLVAESLRQNAENNGRIRSLETQVDNLEIKVFGQPQEHLPF